MRYGILFLFIILSSCQVGQQSEKPAEKWLEEYSEQSPRTDPGDYNALYDDLPESLETLCHLIKCQLLHPLEAREMGMDLEDVYMDGQTPTTHDLLEQFYFRDSLGFKDCRDAEDKIVVACYHHAMLLSSILRSQGIPVRMRAGFSRYYEKQFKIRFGHVICEVWDEQEDRWIKVDPDRQIVDMKDDGFDFACQAWENVTRKKMDPKIYTSSVGEGIKGIVNLLALDASLLLKEEKLYWNLSNIALNDIENLAALGDENIEILNKLARSCSHADQNMSNISDIYHRYYILAPSDLEYETYVDMFYR